MNPEISRTFAVLTILTVLIIVTVVTVFNVLTVLSVLIVFTVLTLLTALAFTAFTAFTVLTVIIVFFEDLNKKKCWFLTYSLTVNLTARDAYASKKGLVCFINKCSCSLCEVIGLIILCCYSTFSGARQNSRV